MYDFNVFKICVFDTLLYSLTVPFVLYFQCQIHVYLPLTVTSITCF